MGTPAWIRTKDQLIKSRQLILVFLRSHEDSQRIGSILALHATIKGWPRRHLAPKRRSEDVGEDLFVNDGVAAPHGCMVKNVRCIDGLSVRYCFSTTAVPDVTTTLAMGTIQSPPLPVLFDPSALGALALS